MSEPRPQSEDDRGGLPPMPPTPAWYDEPCPHCKTGVLKGECPATLRQHIERLRDALNMVKTETVCPDLWKAEQWKAMSELEQCHRCALVIVTAALESVQ